MKRGRIDESSSAKNAESAGLPFHAGAKRLFNIQRGKGSKAPADKESLNVSFDISRGDLHRRVQSFKETHTLSAEQLKAWIEALHAGMSIFVFGIGDKLSILHAFARCMDKSDVLLVEKGGSVKALLDAIVSHPLRKRVHDMRCRELSVFKYMEEVLRMC